MENIKKILVINMVTILLFIFNITYSYAAINSNIELDANVEDKEYKAGDIVTLEVKINSLPEDTVNGGYKKINVLGFNFDYNKEILEINKVYDEDDQEEYEDINALRGWQYEGIDEDTNCLLLINYDFYSNIKENILRIKLKVKKDFKETEININSVEASGGVGAENNFVSNNDLIINLKGTNKDDLYLKTKEYQIGEEKEQDIDEYKEGDKYIIKVLPNTSITDFINNLDTNADTKEIINKAGNKITDYSKLVGTAMKIKLSKENCKDIELTIIVRGDANGNGVIDMGDLTILRGKLYEQKTLEDTEHKALDINFNKVINMNVLTTIRNVLYEGGSLK